MNVQNISISWNITTMWLTGLFALGPLQIWIPDYDHAQILAMTNHWIRLYNLLLYDVFKMMITMLFYLDVSGKNVCQKNLRSKNFKQKLRHQVVKAEALRVEARAIQKLLLSHHWLTWSWFFVCLYSCSCNFLKLLAEVSSADLSVITSLQVLLQSN